MYRHIPHQYIERQTGRVITERMISDRLVNLIYADIRENATWLFNAVTSQAMTSLLSYLYFDLFYKRNIESVYRTINALNIDTAECLGRDFLTSPKKLFERQIRYWENRPMPINPYTVVSPADSRVVAGALSDTSFLFLKEKFFSFEELISRNKSNWIQRFQDGDYMIFRLTPDKYHYNHFPVSGIIVDFYEINGRYHSCNPGAVVDEVTPFSKNKRMVTIIDTDVENGTCVGLVAMVEVVALMIGEIKQCYSITEYDNPQPVRIGMHIIKGQPKSLFRPGSSVDVLIFQPQKINISEDIIRNMQRQDVQSRYSEGFLKPLVETDVRVRSEVAINKRKI